MHVEIMSNMSAKRRVEGERTTPNLFTGCSSFVVFVSAKSSFIARYAKKKISRKRPRIT